MKGILVTFTLTAIGTIGGLISPFIGLCVYISFSIIRPEFMWRWTSLPSANYSRVVALAMLAGWVLHGFGKWNLKRAWPIIGMFLGYWFWMVISAAQAHDSTRPTDLLIFYFKILAPVLVGLTTINTLGKLKGMAWVILLSLGYVAFEMHVYYYIFNYNMARVEGFGGMDNNCLAIEMVTGVGLAYFLGIGSEKWWSKCFALGCAALMAHTILMSFSRGGMLAMGITGMVAFFLIPKKPQHYFLFGLAGVFALVMAGPQVQKRFFSAFQRSESGFEASAQSRLDLWSDAFDLSMRNPIFGVGGDNWGEFASLYGWPHNKEVHSLWVQNLAEVGAPGLFFLLGYFLLTIYYLWPIAKGRTPVRHPWFRDGSRMVIASLVGFMVAAQFVTIKYLEVPFYIAMLGAIILKMNSPMDIPKTMPLTPGPVRQRSSREASQPATS